MNSTVFIVFGILASTVMGSSLAAEPEQARPNIVFFLVDDLGWRDGGCFGSRFYETPNVDRLAKEGMRFTDAYAACHVCSPTRASILTDKYPARLGLTDWIAGRRDFPFQKLKNVRGLQRLPLEETTLAETLRQHGYRTAAIGKWHLGADPSGPTAHGFDVDIPPGHSSGGPRTYHAPFQLRGIEEDTIVVFFANNGGMSAANFGNPKRVIARNRLDQAYASSNLPLRGAKEWLYEGGVRVPMIVKWPGRTESGSVCAEPVISTDFYPSLLEMAGLPARPEQTLDGTSLVPALAGKPFERGAIYWHFPHYSNHGMQSPGGAIRLGDYKLLEYFENGSIQLFNLKEDIGEQHDLSREEPERAARLLAMLHA